MADKITIKNGDEKIEGNETITGNASIGGTETVTGMSNLNGGARINGELRIPLSRPANPQAGDIWYEELIRKLIKI